MAKKSSKKVAKKANRKPAKRVVKLSPKTAKLLFSYTPVRGSASSKSAVSAADRRPPVPPVPIPTTDYHTYIVIDAPSTCANYPVNTLFSYQSADTYITVNMGPGCDPIYAMLDE